MQLKTILNYVEKHKSFVYKESKLEIGGGKPRIVAWIAPRGNGRPECSGCGKTAQFTVSPPKEQAGFDFGGPAPPCPTGYEED